jgi:hypothetical protein
LIVDATYTVKALDDSTWDAFAALVKRNKRGVRRPLVHRVPSRGPSGDAALNRERKRARHRARESLQAAA